MSDKQPSTVRMEMKTTPSHRDQLNQFAKDNDMTVSESLVMLVEYGLKAFEQSKEPNQKSMFDTTPELVDSSAWLRAHFNTIEQVTPPLVEDPETLGKYFQWRLIESVAHGYDQGKGTRLREMECFLLSPYFTQDEVNQWVKWEAIIQEGLYGQNHDEDSAALGLRKQHQLFEKVAADLKVGARKLNVTNVFINNQMVGYNL